ncbi:MAG TPA: hypothetical protein VF997_04520, partial [Polyangia bacterium]
MSEPDPLLPFSTRGPVAAALRPSVALVAAVTVAVAAGAIGGALLSAGAPPPYRLLRATFFG